jgi:hypothetical protein
MFPITRGMATVSPPDPDSNHSRKIIIPLNGRN